MATVTPHALTPPLHALLCTSIAGQPELVRQLEQFGLVTNVELGRATANAREVALFDLTRAGEAYVGAHRAGRRPLF